MKIVGIIPSRFASTRFPGKPLIDLAGKSMIRRVYEQAVQCEELSEVIVATDDDRIYNEVISFGGTAMMTSSEHKNGTERCAEIAEKLETDYIINIQGDEPFVKPRQISKLCEVLDEKVELGTLIKQIKDPEVLELPTVMKVVINHQNEALYFSRTCIPYIRDVPTSVWLAHHTYYKHIGIYAYRKDILAEIIQLPISSLEAAESLEQLRWLENGYTIKVAETEYESIGIDVPEDVDRALFAEGLL